MCLATCGLLIATSVLAQGFCGPCGPGFGVISLLRMPEMQREPMLSGDQKPKVGSLVSTAVRPTPTAARVPGDVSSLSSCRDVCDGTHSADDRPQFVRDRRGRLAHPIQPPVRRATVERPTDRGTQVSRRASRVLSWLDSRFAIGPRSFSKYREGVAACISRSRLTGEGV